MTNRDAAWAATVAGMFLFCFPVAAGADPVELVVQSERTAFSPTVLQLPLDQPTRINVDPTQEYGFLESRNGIYLYRPRNGRILARFPHLEVGSAVSALGGRPLDRPPVARSLPACLTTRWQVGLPAVPAGSPDAADLDGDGRAEIVLTFEDGGIAVLDAAGHSLPGWPIRLESPIHDGPTLFDLDGDGRTEILVTSESGVAHALLAGSVRGELPGWPACLEGGHGEEEVWAAPAAIRTERGEVWVALAGTRGTVQAFTAEGRGRGSGQALSDWEQWNPCAMYASPLLVDIDIDGTFEVAVANNAGQAVLYDLDGKPKRGWPARLAGRPRAGFGCIAARDVDQDGADELVLATDRGFPAPPRLYLLDRGGDPRYGWPIDLPGVVNGGVAIADLDGKPGLEIVVGTLGGQAEIVAYDASGAALPGWPRRFPELSFDRGLVLADLDGDGRPEVIALAAHASYAGGCRLLALDAAGESLPGFPLDFPDADAWGGGMLAHDLDADGHTELLLALSGRAELIVLSTKGRSDAAPWPRSGRVPEDPRRIAGNPAPLPEDFGAGGFSSGSTIASSVETLKLPADLSATLDPRTTFTFVLTKPNPVRLRVIDVRGRLVRSVLDTALPAGLFALAWDGFDDQGRRVGTGSYFFQLEVLGRVEAKQLVVLLE